MKTGGPGGKRWLPVKIAVAAALLAGLLWKVNGRDALRTLAAINPAWIAPLLGMSVVLIGISCIKWQLFLRERGSEVPLLRLFLLYLVGYFFSNFMPGSVGGDLVRSYVLGREIGSRATSFGTVFLERFTGFIALVGMALLAAAVNPGLVATRAMAFFLVFMGLLLVGMIAFLVFRPAHRWVRRLAALLPGGMARKLAAFLDVAFFLHNRPGVFARAMAYSVAFHFMTIVNTQVACLALRIPVSFLDLAVLVPMVLLVSSVPVSLNAIGIMEGAFVFFLGMAGVDPVSALSVGLVLRLKNLVTALIGGVVFAVWCRTPAQAGPADAGEEETGQET